MTGSAADSAREAESLRRDGDPQTAVQLLEEALEASSRAMPELPGWLCGRLAALYRSLGRFDDEVQLLERYRDSQSSEEARSRYDARLSKARTIADRKRRSDSGAVLSVRKVLRTPRRRAVPVGASVGPAAAALRHLSSEQVVLLAALLHAPTSSEADAQLADELGRYCAEARENGVLVERLVEELRTASRVPPPTPALEARYSVALVRLLAAYYEEVNR